IDVKPLSVELGGQDPAHPVKLSRAVRSGAATEQRKRAGVPVEERGPSDLADLAIAEEPADRDVAHMLLEQPAVVVGLAEQVRAAPQTREQQRAVALALSARAIRLEQTDEILGRRAGIAQQEPDDLERPHARRDGEQARLRIEPDD